MNADDFKAKIDRKAGTVRVDDLADYLNDYRARMSDAVMKRDVSERDADVARGKAFLCADLLLTLKPEETHE